MELPMTRVAVSCLAALIALPAMAQPPGATQLEAEARPVINRWIAAFNRGDVAAMAADVYAKADEAALKANFAALREEQFGKLDVYSAGFCSADAAHGKAILKYGRLYTFGGLMDGDEAKVFDLVKTEGGWRISGEADVVFETALSC
jgi:hypothetical protein